MAAAVAHCPADLFAIHSAVDAGRPGIDLGESVGLLANFGFFRTFRAVVALWSVQHACSE
jgi:hypothetical protein